MFLSSPLFRKLLRMTLAVIIGACVAFTALLFLLQRRMIYFPRDYDPIDFKRLPWGTRELEYQTGEGPQVAFYVPPEVDADKPPDRLWLMFGGNASLALDWLETVEKALAESRQDHWKTKDAVTPTSPTGSISPLSPSSPSSPSPDPSRASPARVGYLLIDYPGYGKCKGTPSDVAILESTEAAFRRLAQHLKTEPADLERDLNVMGHSLGAAAALQFAVRHPIRRAVIISPFTSLVAMARSVVHWPLCYLVRDRFDNHARLAELLARPNPPAVAIFHGDADQIVPVRMGRELSKSFPQITYREVHNGDHNFILSLIEDQLVESCTDE